jgi:hypothetical protein
VAVVEETKDQPHKKLSAWSLFLVLCESGKVGSEDENLLKATKKIFDLHYPAQTSHIQ